MLDFTKGGMLPSQEIRELITDSYISGIEDKNLEGRIQPASFEPSCEDICYVVPHGFRPETSQQVNEALRCLPTRLKKKQPLEGGYEIKPGYAYLFPLEGRFSLPETMFVKANPKSTQGRLFNFVRLLSDFYTEYDGFEGGRELKLWALVEPLAFCSIVYPAQTFTQLRFYNNSEEILSDSEVRELYKKTPLLTRKNKDGEEFPVPLSETKIHNGLCLNIDILGEVTGGVIGLIARKNPDAIDLTKIGHYNSEDYFDLEFSPEEDELYIEPHEYRLMFSTTKVNIPENLAGELTDYSTQYGEIRWHFAGFFDPSFKGTAVLEIVSHESERSVLKHNQPVSRVVYHKLRQTPDKQYGKEIGSSYQNQEGVKVARVFEQIGMVELARKFEKELVDIVVVDAKKLVDPAFNGFKPIGERDSFLETIFSNPGVIRRRDAEHDESIKQPIPYVVIHHPGSKEFFVYQRAHGREVYGERRLYGKLSIGVGGHVRENPDFKKREDFIKNCLRRELFEEVEGLSQKDVDSARLIGYLNVQDAPVDRVHFGLVYLIEIPHKSICLKDPALKMSSFRRLEELANEPRESIENWTWSLIKPLQKIIR